MLSELADISMPIGNYKYSLNMTKFFSRNTDKRIRSLANTYQAYDTHEEIIDIAKEGEVIMMESKIRLSYLVSQMSDR